MGLNKAAQELGKLGGQTTAARHGKAHFSEAGKKGMANRWGAPRGHSTKLLQRNVVGGQNGYSCRRCGQQLLAWSAKEANAMTMYPCVRLE